MPGPDQPPDNPDDPDDPSADDLDDPSADDPRLREECVARIPGRAGTLVLVGVVHDHPASTFRVRTVVGAESPAVLALELPPLAVPLYRQYAADERIPPAFGGEMSAAVQAAPSARIAGIDGPSAAFVARLARVLYRERASGETIARTVRRVTAIARTALRYRLGALVGRLAALRVEVDSPANHAVARDDPAERQATDEAAQVRRANAMLAAFDAPASDDLCTATRERHMASRLASLRDEGDVVAVLGMGHLDRVADLLVNEF